MKKFLFLLGIIIIPLFAGAQILNPVRWNYSAKKTGANQYEIHLKATIDKGWHVYAQDAGNGPIPTSFTFNKSSDIQLTGKVKEQGKLLKAYDRNFNSILKFYENAVDFVQAVKVKPGAKAVSGTLEYMVCDNKQCLPPKDIDFSIKL